MFKVVDACLNWLGVGEVRCARQTIDETICTYPS